MRAELFRRSRSCVQKGLFQEAVPSNCCLAGSNREKSGLSVSTFIGPRILASKHGSVNIKKVVSVVCWVS